LIKQVLVPLDGSDAAEAVLPFVERIATATNASTVLVAAIDRPRDWGEDTDGDVKGASNEAESYLRRLQARLASATGNDVEFEVIESEPAGAILWACEKRQPDLIAMTTHGRSGLARWVLGSVAAKLLHSRPTPMLIVRPPAEKAAVAGGNIEKILVPLDGSEVAASALPFAADLAKALGASVCLFQTVPEPIMIYPGAEAVFDPRVQKEVEAAAQKFLASTAERLTTQGVAAESVTSFGNTVDGIVGAAEREKADLIVMSTHGRSGMGRMVLGSVADAVVRRTLLPVVLVRPTIGGKANG
jgi:nucleotide-binding universal stress UspA family protein